MAGLFTAVLSIAFPHLQEDDGVDAFGSRDVGDTGLTNFLVHEFEDVRGVERVLLSLEVGDRFLLALAPRARQDDHAADDHDHDDDDDGNVHPSSSAIFVVTLILTIWRGSVSDAFPI